MAILKLHKTLPWFALLCRVVAQSTVKCAPTTCTSTLLGSGFCGAAWTPPDSCTVAYSLNSDEFCAAGSCADYYNGVCTAGCDAEYLGMKEYALLEACYEGCDQIRCNCLLDGVLGITATTTMSTTSTQSSTSSSTTSSTTSDAPSPTITAAPTTDDSSTDDDTSTYCSILSHQPKGLCKSCLQAYTTTEYTFRHDPNPRTTSGLYQVYMDCPGGMKCSSISSELDSRYGNCIKDITTTKSKGSCTVVVDWHTRRACDAEQTRALAAACTTYCLAE